MKLLFNRENYTPSSLSAKLQEKFDHDFGSIWVEGEIAELSLPSSGHAYFTLKDTNARLKALIWKGRRPYAAAALNEGMFVTARGRLAIYAPRGDFQLVVDYMEPKGEGALRAAFEKLKLKLAQEGLFDEERKRPLPFWPSKVALISSATGAAAKDFIHTALGLRPKADIDLYPVRVQGEGAAEEIAQAVHDLNSKGGYDLIVISRGGGSLADLWAFNEEIVVRAVAGSRTVSLAAIGHSTDLSLCELAADQRAITPTAAAEAIFRDEKAFILHIQELKRALIRSTWDLASQKQAKLTEQERRLSYGIKNFITRDQQEFRYLTHRLGRFEDRLGFAGQQLDDLSKRLGSYSKNQLEQRARKLASLEDTLRLLSPCGKINGLTKSLAELERNLYKAINNHLEWEKDKIISLKAQLEALSPKNILRRGYALVRKQDGTALSRAQDVSNGDEISIHLAEGRLTSLVKDVIDI